MAFLKKWKNNGKHRSKLDVENVINQQFRFESTISLYKGCLTAMKLHQKLLA